MRNRVPADLFQRLPGHFRTRDAAEGRPLEALMGVFSAELGILEQDIDQLYDNWFVETCEPWALPYIAGLVGASPMRDIGADQAGLLRAYIANVLQYRQAKGAAAVVEQVARDVSGWPVVAVEFFQRVAASQNVNHVRPGTPAFADVRNAAAARISRSPFSKMAHSPAAGAPNGWSGRYNIPHLGLFVWRRSAAPLWPVEDDEAGYLGGPQPYPNDPDPGLLHFDPLGRDLPLVNRPAADLSIAARMTERTAPAPLSRDAVSTALNAARDTGSTPGRWFEDAAPFRVRLDGAEVPPAKLFCCNLEKAQDGSWRRPLNAGEVLVDPVLGRLSLHADDEGQSVETGFAHSTPFDIGGGAYDRRTSLEKWLPDFVIEGEPPVWQIGVSKIDGAATIDPLQGGPVVSAIADAVKSWNDFAAEGARGIITVLDSAAYTEALTHARAIKLPPGSRLAIVAAAWPEVEEEGGVKTRIPGTLSPRYRRPALHGTVVIDAEDAGKETPGSLVIDGLVLGGFVTAKDDGDMGALRLYNCTVGATGPQLARPIRSIVGNARMSLVLDRCIVSGVDLPHSAGTLEITRSIIGEDRTADTGANTIVLKTPRTDASISGSTVFGRVACRTIHAENSILLGDVAVEFRQAGCVRFCWVEQTSALPRRYRCVPRAGDDPKPRPVFVSTRFADVGLGQLNLCTPAAILEGAEDGMEMGVGYANRDPARRANMRDAVQEFAPFGLVQGLIYVT